MASHRLGRITEDIHRELTAIFREVKDPRVQEGLISIVRVDVTNDLSYCTVYISAMQGWNKRKWLKKGLKSAAGFIRRELGTSFKIAPCSPADFTATDSIEYGAGISKLINDLKRRSIMKIKLQQAADVLQKADEVLVLSHKSPDGDTLGSASALCTALQKNGKTCPFCMFGSGGSQI